MTITHDFGMPTDTDSPYTVGIRGTFYFRYAEGPNINQEGGIMRSAGVSLNSKLA